MIAAVALATSCITFAVAHPAAADLGTGNTISVSSGTGATTFSLNLTAFNNSCQGDTASGNYRWHQYVAAGAVDPSTISFTGGALTAPAGGFVQPLYSTSGTPQVNRSTSGVTGQITGVVTNNLLANTIPGNGTYTVGFLCTLAGTTTRYWVTTIVVSGWTGPTTFAWSTCTTCPGPARFGTAFGDEGTITGSFPAVDATPPVTTYTVTATAIGGFPDPASPRILDLPAAVPFTMAGNNGTLYEVTVVATNAVGTGYASRLSRLRVGPYPFGPIITTSSAIGGFDVSWNEPTSAPPPTLIDVTIYVSPSVPGSPFTVPAGTGTIRIAAPGGTYEVAVQPNFAPGYAVSARIATATSFSTLVLIQDIQTRRPQGALVLTQRCGVQGSAAPFANDVFGALPPLAATPGADPTGVDPPDAIGTAPLTGAGPADPLFPQYPYPVDGNGDAIATYPTQCGIDLGTGALITSGPRAGQYFKATGRIDQLTVVNTRDTDNGWTLNGRMSTFTSTTDVTDTFSGNLLGWDPELTWDSSANLDGYDMAVAAGNARQPEPSASTTGLGAPFNSVNTTLANSLAQSPPGASLGQAVLDARLRLLIPVTVDAGTYRGTLTFTTI